jgi:hypothetical protein
MIDFSEIATEQLIARGQYSIARKRRVDQIAVLQSLCDQQLSAVSSVLRDVQNASNVDRHFAFMRVNMEKMAETVAEIDELTGQLAIIRPLAFPE